MAKNSVRIRLKAYEHRIFDASAEKIVQAAQAHGAKKIVGPVPLPTEKQVVTILRAVHKYKDSREQFEIRTHKRLIEIVGPTAETIDSLSRLELPSGVDLRTQTGYDAGIHRRRYVDPGNCGRSNTKHCVTEKNNGK